MSAKRKLLYSTFLSIFSTSLIWTGLPLLLYLITDSHIISSALFVTSSVARILAAFTSGYFIDRFSNKKIMLISIIIMMMTSVLIYYFVIQESFVFLFTFMIVYQFFGSISALSKNIWYRSLINDDEMIQAISTMSTYDKSAKTIGFTLGPLFFTVLHEHTIILNFFFLIFALLFIIKIKTDTSQDRNISSIWAQYSEAFLFIIKQKNILLYASVSILVGIIGPTLLSMATYIIGERYQITDEISIFWLVSGIGVILSNIFLSKINKSFFGTSLFFIIFFVLYCGGLLILSFSTYYIFFIICFAMFTLGGPFVMNVIQANLFIHTSKTLKGKVIGLIQSASDFGTLITIVLSWWIIEVGNINYFLYCLVGLSFIMFILFTRPMQNKYEN